MRIREHIHHNWSRLRSGEKIELRADLVIHPSADPDFKMAPGWPRGQRCDYVTRLTDGSRIHAQCFVRNGVATIELHRDQWDPDRSFGHMVKHALFETPIGPTLGFLAFAMIVSRP